MDASVCIEQTGTVEEIRGHTIRVKTLREASCGQCSANGLCFLGESTERIVEISNFTPDIKIGDTVGIVISRSLGNKAIFLAYLVPFLLLLSVLILLNQFGIPDWLAGTLAISVLIPYFFILHLFKNRLQKSFTLSARKKLP